MTKEDIIKLAREAEFEVYETDVWITDGWWTEELEHFAALVAAAERDRMCQQFNIPKELAYEKATGNEAN